MIQQGLLIPGAETIHRPALRYFGGKFNLAPWIIRHFPQHNTYVEPFGGAYSVGCQKMPSRLEVYNDLNPDAANFFKVLRQEPEALITAIAASPRTAAEFRQCQSPCDEPLEWARRYYLYCHIGFMGGGGRWSSGTSRERLELAAIQDDSHLWPIARRIERLIIQLAHAHICISAWDGPETLFYVDPPYPFQARRSRDKRHKNGAPRRQYAYELGSDEQHRELAAVLHRVRGKVVLSGYDCPLYQELFSDWRQVRSSTQSSCRETVFESLWMNF